MTLPEVLDQIFTKLRVSLHISYSMMSLHELMEFMCAITFFTQ